MINIIILLYKFGQTWKTLTLQDSWNDLQFGMEGVSRNNNEYYYLRQKMQLQSKKNSLEKYNSRWRWW